MLDNREFRIVTNGTEYRLQQRTTRSGWRRIFGRWTPWAFTAAGYDMTRMPSGSLESVKARLESCEEMQRSLRAEAIQEARPWTPTSGDPLVDELEETFANNGR